MSKDIIAAAIHPALESYIPIAEGIARTFGDFCEVSVHDFTDISASIVAIFNRHVTGRSVGSPVTNLGLEVIRQGREGKSTMVNYMNPDASGKQIKSSSMLIRDESGQLIGCLCINLDLTQLLLTQSVLDGIAATDSTGGQEEEFSLNIAELEERIIRKGIEQIGKPIPAMNRQERTAFLSYLDEKGLFLIKGAIQRVATLMDVSKYTLYSYLDRSGT